jgi:hypothetical protein
MVNGRPRVGCAACLGPWPGPTAWDDFFPRGAANLGHGSPRAATWLTQRRTREGAAHWCHFSTKGAQALNVGGQRQGWWWHWGSIMVSGAETARTSWGKSQARQRPRNADGKKRIERGGRRCHRGRKETGDNGAPGRGKFVAEEGPDLL